MDTNRLDLHPAAQLTREAFMQMREADQAAERGDLIHQLHHGYEAVSAYDELHERGWVLTEPRVTD